MGARSVGTILIIALSGLLLGFDGSLFTGAVVFVKQQFGLTEFELGWTVSSHTLSATLSIFLAGPLADRIGRRTVLRTATVMFAASALMAAAANGYFMLIVARLLSGLGVGAVFVAAPMYIAEISPPALRGRMVTVNQLFLVCGIFLASASNLLIVQLDTLPFEWLRLDLAGTRWRWMLGIGVVPAVLYLFAFRGADLEMLALGHERGVTIAIAIMAAAIVAIRARQAITSRDLEPTLDPVADDSLLMLRLSEGDT